MIFEFDGPIADLSAALPATAAEQLRAILHAETPDLPPAIADTGDPFEILAYAAGISPGLAAHIDRQLTSLEVTAAATARPAAYVHETLAACRDSGRTPAIVSRNSAEAVSSYLATHGLAEQVRHVTAAPSYPPGHLQTGPHLVEDTIQALGASPAECALITASAASISIAQNAGTDSIGYATDPATSERLTDAGAGCVIPSLADLTLRLRARPLPN